MIKKICFSLRGLEISDVINRAIFSFNMQTWSLTKLLMSFHFRSGATESRTFLMSFHWKTDPNIEVQIGPWKKHRRSETETAAVSCERSMLNKLFALWCETMNADANLRIRLTSSSSPFNCFHSGEIVFDWWSSKLQARAWKASLPSLHLSIHL